MELFFFLLIWAGLAFFIGNMAESRGRSFAGFFLLSFVMSPILSFIVLMVMKDEKEEERRAEKERSDKAAHIEAIKAIAGSANLRRDDEKSCPMCAETIKAAALKCRHCGSLL